MSQPFPRAGTIGSNVRGGALRSLSITWTLHSHGWAFVKVADEDGGADVVASYVTDGPEQFLSAIARLVLGDKDT
jgi:hypothetical protein